MGLGLTQYHTAGAFAPRLEYNAKSGRISRVDRTADGTETMRVDITMTQPAFVIDLGSIEIGWLNFQAGTAPTFVTVPYGQPMPERPDRAHKAGFRAKVWEGRDPTAREFSASAGVTVNAIEALWDQLTAAPEAATGKVPVIRFVNAIPVVAGKGTNYAPDFRLVQWIDRDATVFGPRTVAAPGQPAIAPVAANTNTPAQAAASAWPGSTPAIVAPAAWPVAA
jgi:hypothetical protein